MTALRAKSSTSNNESPVPNTVNQWGANSIELRIGKNAIDPDVERVGLYARDAAKKLNAQKHAAAIKYDFGSDASCQTTTAERPIVSMTRDATY
jgi:hypothetical protein